MNIYSQIPDTYALSNSQIAEQLGQRFRDYRISLGLTQKDIAFQSGLSVMSIVRFEKGKGNSIGLGNLIALFRAIQRLDDITNLIPEMPKSLYPKTGKR